ncbi:FAD/NAD-P-binding domain-containing protein [Lenzites betulinus]|nr:FAD/NAD-P-binding domain-containing protein [Lenzites betulinus]
MPPSLYYDVIIIGGGPAGCATALSIAQHDKPDIMRVLVIDDSDPDAFKIGESLPAPAKRALSLLDPTLPTRIAEDTANGLHSRCTGNASAWTTAHLEETYALMNPYGAGWHLDRALFDETLRETCAARGYLRKGKFVAVRRVDEPGVFFGWAVDTEMTPEASIETLHARWVVDATGRRASVARKLGAKQRRHHDLLAFYIVFNSTLDADAPTSDHHRKHHDNDNRTLIEAAPSGWWYSARLPHNKRLVTYTTAPSDPSARIARTTSGFLDMVASETQHISTALGMGEDGADVAVQPAYAPCTETRAFTRTTAAGSSVLEPCAAWEAASPCGSSMSGRGWCAVGDAALAFDPLSSQGMITALNSGLFLGGVLARALGPGTDDASAGTAATDDAVSKIRAAYEVVRKRYEEGRAYYYDIVRRFEGQSEVDDGGDSGAFWTMQRSGGTISLPVTVPDAL